MTAPAAILALTLAVRPPLSLVREAERVDLPPSASSARLEPHPFTREWILSVPPSSVPAVAFRLRGASRLCPEVVPGKDHVRLRCVTARLRATVVHDSAGTALALHRLSVPPWRPEEEGPPLPAFDLVALRMGGCPGKTLELQGECAFAAGDPDAARALFEQAVQAGPAPLAELRLGDFALQDDDPDAAVAHWRMARAEAPWGRLASARLCEVDPRCLASPAFEAVYDGAAVERALRADLVLRRERLAAFDGALGEAAQRLSAETVPGGACQAALPWCRHVILLALQHAGPTGVEALSAYMSLYGRREGPLALELVRAASVQAERAGAPLFAANLLAGATGSVAADDLEPHLRRMATLYLAAGDRAHADEIVRYARSRLPEASLRTAAWMGLRRGVRPPAPPSTAAPDAAEQPDPDLAAAEAALAAARLVTAPPVTKKGATP